MKILVLGLARSGSTWIANSLAKSLNLRVFQEPENDVNSIIKKNENFLIKHIFEKKEYIENNYNDFDMIFVIQRDFRDIAISKLLYRCILEKEIPPFLIKKLIHNEYSIIDNLSYKNTFHNQFYFNQVLNDKVTSIITYEKFVNNNFSELTSLKSKISHHSLTGFQSRKYRLGKPGNWKRWFTNNDIEKVKKFIIKSNMDPDIYKWNNSDEKITYEETIEYVINNTDGNLKISLDNRIRKV